MLITTTDVLQGIEIEEYIGIVAARFQTSLPEYYDDGKNDAAAEELLKTVENKLKEAAEKLNANAVIGLKFTQDGSSGDFFTVMGTAVRIKK